MLLYADTRLDGNPACRFMLMCRRSGVDNQGYISYPRTESTAFSPHFDVHAICVEHQGHPDWGGYVTNLLASAGVGVGGGKVSVPRTKGGVDAGDHPPITPTQCCSRSKIKNSDEYRMYDIIARSFFATLSPPFRYREWKCVVELGGGEKFTYSHFVVEAKGWTEMLPWRVGGVTRGLPEAPTLRANRGDPVACHGCEKVEKITVAPPYLRESDLVDLMDRHGIGTDASISQHIQTICERKYVVVCDEDGVILREACAGGGRDHPNSGNGGSKKVVLRHMVPTPLGAALISCFDEVCPRLAQPSLRASMERQLTLIATGAADKKTVLDQNLASFLKEYTGFASEIARVRPYFVSDDAIDGIIEATRAAAADQHLNTLSDSAIRRQDEEANVVSNVIADAERRRRFADREAARQASHVLELSEEDQIKSLFSYGAPTADTLVAGYTETSGQQRFYSGSSGVAHYTSELQRLRELSGSTVESAAAVPPLQKHRRNNGGGIGRGRGGRGGTADRARVEGGGGGGGRRGGRGGGGSRERRKGVFLDSSGSGGRGRGGGNLEPRGVRGDTP